MFFPKPFFKVKLFGNNAMASEFFGDFWRQSDNIYSYLLLEQQLTSFSLDELETFEIIVPLGVLVEERFCSAFIPTTLPYIAFESDCVSFRDGFWSGLDLLCLLVSKMFDGCNTEKIALNVIDTEMN